MERRCPRQLFSLRIAISIGGYNLNAVVTRTICRMLIVSLLALPFNFARAGMVGADQLAATHGGKLDREALLTLIGRSEAAAQLQALGIDPGNASKRVAALSDEEIRSVAGRLESLPAGAGTTSPWAMAFVIGFALLLYLGWR